MKRIAVLVSFAAIGCTTHKDLRDARALSGERVTVETTRGRTTAHVHSVGNKVTFTDDGGQPIASETIVRIEDKSHASGAGQGLLAGAGLGFLAGLALPATDSDCDCAGLGVVYGIYLGAIGGLAGLVVGTLRGSTTVYESKTGVTVQVGGPSGSTAGLTVKF